MKPIPNAGGEPSTVAVAVRCRGLTKRYDTRAVVDGVDLGIERGEVFGFLGPNGAGKTTTIKILLGLIRADAGEAWILGSKVPCPARLGEIGAMVEEPAFYPWMSGRRNLQVLADEGPPVPTGAVEEALESTGIAAAADRKVKTYSQGMRQRLGLAAATLRKPPVVLLDEPANGLDPAGIHDLRILLRRLADQGSAVLLSSHLLGEVEQVCDRVAVIDRGRLITMGALDSLGGAQRVVVTVDPEEVTAVREALSRWTVTSITDGEVQVTGATGRDVIIAAAVRPTRLSLEEWFLDVTEGAERDATAAG